MIVVRVRALGRIHMPFKGTPDFPTMNDESKSYLPHHGEPTPWDKGAQQSQISIPPEAAREGRLLGKHLAQ